VFASWREKSTRDTYVRSGTPGKDSIFLHELPPSSLIWIRPSSVPTARRFSRFSLSASATMFP